MTLERFRAYCLAKPGATEDLPFGPETLVFRVGGGNKPGKIFTLTGLDTFAGINLKCDPERAIDLRERYPGIVPGYHMNKQHWNTVATDGSVPDPLLLELADHSYALVRDSLPKREREALVRRAR